MRFLLIPLFFFALNPCWAAPDTKADSAVDAAPTSWGVPQLMQSLAQVKSAKGKFTERKYMSILSVPLNSSGVLIYEAPGRLEKHTLQPRVEDLVLDQGKLTIENKAKNQRHVLVLQDYPGIWMFVESIRSTLAGDQQMLNRFYRVSLEGNERRWRLLLLPIDAKMKEAVKEIRIGGSMNWVGSVEILEASGDHSLMTITEDAQ